MKLSRRKFLHLAAGAPAISAAAGFAWGQTYPARPVRIIVGFPAGGPNDILARLVGQWLQERLGRPFVVENRPGAGGNVATESVARAAADGYTLLLIGTFAAINPTLYDKLNFIFLRDIAPIAGLIRVPNVIEVHPSFPATTVPELIAYAKSDPGKVTMALPGNGTGPHLAGELFKMMAGVSMLNVPYRGATPALTDLLAGQVQVMFDGLPSSIPYIKAGKLRALALTGAARSDALPDTPTVGEFLTGYEASVWFGLGAPEATPIGIIEELNHEINAGLTDARLNARLADLGGTIISGTPADFGKMIADETLRWSKVIRAANIKPD